jgi:hypothetical protein
MGLLLSSFAWSYTLLNVPADWSPTETPECAWTGSPGWVGRYWPPCPANRRRPNPPRYCSLRSPRTITEPGWPA